MTLETIEFELWTLFEQSQQGDKQAYKQLLQRMATLIRAYLRRRLTRQEADVEDLVQEVLCGSYQAPYLRCQSANYGVDARHNTLQADRFLAPCRPFE